MTREYLSGTCYTCQKCLFCFTSESCKCKKKINKSAVKMSNRSIDFDNDEEDEDVSEFSESEEYNLDEIKLHIVIEKKGKKTSTSKTITIKPVDYISTIEGINSAV